MALEQQLGFRSSFNLIPEGEYRVTDKLRDAITSQGFELGVHDLHHDGKLFSNGDDFARKAQRINHYLKAWGAVGFRAGFMLHNLDWIHDLAVAYDASTFDTDPFEPQPHGQHTIFPFWVPRPAAAHSSLSPQLTPGLNGYVELPYTLPQDSTLFLILGEKHPDIWMQKLDWVAKHGGMVLLDTHPDYLAFGKASKSRTEYPAAFYERLLNYIQTKYSGQYWHATPKELASWYTSKVLPNCSQNPQKPPKTQNLAGKSAAVVLFSYYPADPRPRRAAEALASEGMHVEMICLKQDKSDLDNEIINGVRIKRIPLKKRRDGKIAYFLQYASFLAISGGILCRRAFGTRYSLVHVHNMPDFLVFSALIPKLLGARVILDLHDPMPELMCSIFRLPDRSWPVRLLRLLERLSLAFADQGITVNLACRDIFIARSCPADKMAVVINAPDEAIFQFSEAKQLGLRKSNSPFVIMYHGSIVERHGLDLAIHALNAIRGRIPQAELRIYGTSTAFLETALETSKKLGLESAVRFYGPKTLKEITSAIAACDVGVIPNRRSIFTEINTPTRIFEYLALGKPVIAPRAPGITTYFGSNELVFFELGNEQDLARQLEYVYNNPEETHLITQRGQAIYREHSWTRERQSFLDLVSGLLMKKV
jgi:glycosyltransferase involved in cell wall biosynthesis